MHPRPQPARPTERPKLRESIALVRSDARLSILLIAVMVVAFTSDPVTTLTPAFVTEIFGHKDTWVGALIGAYGAGAVLAALSAGRLRDPERTLAMGLTIMGGGTLAFALAPNIGVGLAGMLVGGYGYLTSSTTTTAALQLGVEDSQRGRVMAIWSVAFVGVRPFGSLADGGIASGWGLRPAAVVFALPGAADGRRAAQTKVSRRQRSCASVVRSRCAIWLSRGRSSSRMRSTSSGVGCHVLVRSSMSGPPVFARPRSLRRRVAGR